MTKRTYRITFWILTAALTLAACSIAYAADVEPAQIGLAVNVRAFGATGDGFADDTAAIQAAFDANKSHEVVFPSGTYRITDTIKINGRRIIGVGAAVIRQDNPEKDIFFSDFAWRLTIRGLHFDKGVNQLNMGNPNADTGVVLIEDCDFTNSSGVAILMREKSNSTHLQVQNCRLVKCDQALVTYTDQTTFRDCFLETAWMRNKAVIENRGGIMVCDTICGVPLVTGADQRWIDNYGHLECRAFRFGGEFGGFTPVVNWGKYNKTLGGPSVLLQNCWVSAESNNERKCAVYCEEVPNSIVIRDCALAGVPPVIVSPRIDLDTYFRNARQGMLHFDLSNNAGEQANNLPDEMLAAVNARDTSPEIPGQLDPDATREAMARIAEAVKKLSPAGGEPQEYEGRTQRIDPAEYIEISIDPAAWDLEDYMDATFVKNSEYLSVAPVGDDLVILLRSSAPAWPHVLFKNVTIDLDATPFLSWQLKDNGMPSGYAVKAIDTQTGKLAMLAEQSWAPFFDYRAVDLRKAFDLGGGKRSFDIRFYALGNDNSNPIDLKSPQAGNYMVVDFIRAEAP